MSDWEVKLDIPIDQVAAAAGLDLLVKSGDIGIQGVEEEDSSPPVKR